jgi:hypothetical protein
MPYKTTAFALQVMESISGEVLFKELESIKKTLEEVLEFLNLQSIVFSFLKKSIAQEEAIKEDQAYLIEVASSIDAAYLFLVKMKGSIETNAERNFPYFLEKIENLFNAIEKIFDELAREQKLGPLQLPEAYKNKSTLIYQLELAWKAAKRVGKLLGVLAAPEEGNSSLLRYRVSLQKDLAVKSLAVAILKQEIENEIDKDLYKERPDLLARACYVLKRSQILSQNPHLMGSRDGV